MHARRQNVVAALFMAAVISTSVALTHGDTGVDDRLPTYAPEYYDDYYETSLLPPELAQLIVDRVELGLRVSYFLLLDDSRGADDPFLETITKLEPVNDLDILDSLVGLYKFTPYLGLEVAGERIGVKTVSGGSGHTDGIFVLSGATISIVARLPNRSRYTPYAGVGFSSMNASIKANPVWQNGFEGTPTEKQAAYQAWIAAGSPPNPNNLIRTLVPDDSVGFVVTAGTTARLKGAWDLDLFVRYTHIDTRIHYYETRTQNGVTAVGHFYETIPAQNIDMGLGIRYSF